MEIDSWYRGLADPRVLSLPSVLPNSRRIISRYYYLMLSEQAIALWIIAMCAGVMLRHIGLCRRSPIP